MLPLLKWNVLLNLYMLQVKNGLYYKLLFDIKWQKSLAVSILHSRPTEQLAQNQSKEPKMIITCPVILWCNCLSPKKNAKCSSWWVLDATFGKSDFTRVKLYWTCCVTWNLHVIWVTSACPTQFDSCAKKYNLIVVFFVKSSQPTSLVFHAYIFQSTKRYIFKKKYIHESYFKNHINLFFEK